MMRVHNDSAQTQREVNCGQIFAKGPILTKEIFDKVNNELVPKKTNFCGKQLKTKRVLYITGLLLLLSFSTFGAILMWFTNAFDNLVLSFVVISNNESENYKTWQSPPLRILYKVHLFNYTNVREFENKMEKKLRVKEVGPYVYEEQMEKVNVVFHDDKISYQLNRKYAFVPELSNGKISDLVTIPNIPLLVGSSKVKYENYFARLAFSSILNGFDEKPFLTVTANSFIMGYSSSFYDMARTLNEFNHISTPEKMGLLNSRIGIEPHVFTINTGAKDLEKLGLIEKFDSKDSLDYYLTDECNAVSSSEGAMYPPKAVQRKDPLKFLFPNLCRTIPLEFNKETTVFNGKVPVYQYVMPDDIFDTADEKPSNQCYCSSSGQCPLKGLFNVSICNHGTPMYASHPHFRNADPSLVKAIDGLEPEKHTEQSYMNLHPFMGFGITAKNKLQLNIQVHKSYGLSQLERFEDNMVLPLVWYDVVLDEDHIYQPLIDIIYETSFTVPRVRLAFKYLTLLTALISFLSLVLILIRGKDYRWLNYLKRQEDDDVDSDSLYV